MEYQLYLKSHCEAPDYEDTCLASSKLKAAKKFQRRLNQLSEDYWDISTILENMDRV